MKTSTKLLALAGIAGALTLAGCGPAYDRSYGYGGYGGSYENSYNYSNRGYSYAPSYGHESRSYYYAPRRSYYDDYGRRPYYRRY
jgi:hypothetical protein